MSRPHNAPDIFRAIGHPARRRMLELLRERPLTVAELGEHFSVNAATVSEHVRALRIAGLIGYREKGARHEYSLNRQRLQPVQDWVRPFTRAS